MTRRNSTTSLTPAQERFRVLANRRQAERGTIRTFDVDAQLAALPAGQVAPVALGPGAAIDVMEKARIYVRSQPPGIGGAGGEKECFAIACEIAKWGLSEEQVFTVLDEEYGRRCVPPWSDLQQLKHKAHDAVQRHAETFSGISDKTRQEKEAAHVAAAVRDPWTPARATDGDAERFLTRGRMVDRSKLPPPLVYVIPGLDLAPGKVSAIQAFANVAKTPFGLQLCICVASGRPFLGLDVVQCRTLYLAFEGGILTEEREARICAGLGLDRAQVPLDFMHVEQTLDDAGFLEDLEAYVSAHEIGLVMLDTYGSAIPGEVDHNSNLFANWMHLLGKISDRTKALIVVLIHENKSDRATGLKKISGHNVAPGKIQAAIALRRTSDDRNVIDVECSRETRMAFKPFRVRFTDPPCEGAPTGFGLLGVPESMPDEGASGGKKRAYDVERARVKQEAIERAGQEIWKSAKASPVTMHKKDLLPLGGGNANANKEAATRLCRAELLKYSGGSYLVLNRDASPLRVKAALAGLSGTASAPAGAGADDTE